MALRKITFDGATVSSKDDADINYHLFDLIPAGIIKGLGNEIPVSAGNNTITFGSGYLQIYGRRIFMEPNTQISITLDATRNGYIAVDINLAQNTLELTRIEISSGWPTLIQNNLSNSIGRYQFAIAKYSKTPTSLSLDASFAATRPMIKTLSDLVNEKNQEVYDWALGKFSNKIIPPVDLWATVMKYNLTDFPGQATDCLIHVRLGKIATFTFSGRHLINASIQSLAYRYIGVDYYLTIEYTSSQMYLYSNNTSHRISSVEVFR
ncbi:hypothetical protein N7603_02095 [Acholeplasma vituli]|jgi:hypothetical protein|uniref:Uncharacterized protein n=1 Tax=Paracholeplasma vituli TaxID=69473 RepID=A0ABT2PVL5_9MOLU|nr:hypothetical protein [Paracholeplasma vituli]MCU0104446.1 hypothetical protein [Paracholeplasma vituli]